MAGAFFSTTFLHEGVVVVRRPEPPTPRSSGLELHMLNINTRPDYSWHSVNV